MIKAVIAAGSLMVISSSVFAQCLPVVYWTKSHYYSKQPDGTVRDSSSPWQASRVFDTAKECQGLIDRFVADSDAGRSPKVKFSPVGIFLITTEGNETWVTSIQCLPGGMHP